MNKSGLIVFSSLHGYPAGHLASTALNRITNYLSHVHCILPPFPLTPFFALNRSSSTATPSGVLFLQYLKI